MADHPNRPIVTTPNGIVWFREDAHFRECDNLFAMARDFQERLAEVQQENSHLRRTLARQFMRSKTATGLQYLG
jgi:hypothetical protein